MRQGDWLAKIDLKDDPTASWSPESFCSSPGKQDYQFHCLPCGLSCSSWAFMKLVMAFLRALVSFPVIHSPQLLIITGIMPSNQQEQISHGTYLLSLGRVI